MNPFRYERPLTQKDALDALQEPGAQLLAGGTNLVDLMKRGVMTPGKLIDINRLPLKNIELRNGVLAIGALALNSTVAEHPMVTARFPLLAQALQSGATQQLRNMATVGGNLLQRTRCYYFYDTALPCNKRQPGSGCGAREGYNRIHAIFGASDHCIATHPSDMAVALAALDAVVVVTGSAGERRIPLADFHRLPGDAPERDTVLAPNELILAVELPENPFTRHVHYLKVRDRASYAFALVSVAAALQLDGSTIREARLAMGGVAHKPWRLKEAEETLKGKPAAEETFRQAASVAMRGAQGYGYNNFKLKLAPESLVEALKTAAAKA